MTFQCRDCNKPIEGEPWWYDPARAINRDAQVTERTEVVFRCPNRPTPASAPFHRACLELEIGRIRLLA
jgi:hypothetical protein